MVRTLVLLALSSLPAVTVVAQSADSAQHHGFTATGVGIAIIGVSHETKLPETVIRINHIEGHVIAPDISIGVLPLPFITDIHVSLGIPLGSDRAMLALGGGPSFIVLLLGEGGFVPGIGWNAGLVLRDSGGMLVRFDAGQRFYRGAEDVGPRAGVWQFGVSIMGAGSNCGCRGAAR